MFCLSRFPKTKIIRKDRHWEIGSFQHTTSHLRTDMAQQNKKYNVTPQNWHGSTKQKAVTENHQKRNERITTERLAASSIQHRTSERAWLNKTKRSIIKSMTSTHDLRKRYLAQRCGLARNHFSILSIRSVSGLCALWHCTLKSVFPYNWGIYGGKNCLPRRIWEIWSLSSQTIWECVHPKDLKNGKTQSFQIGKLRGFQRISPIKVFT